MITRIWITVALALAGAAASASAQASRPLPCAPDAPSPSFLTAASDIEYACGYLLRSRPPNFTLAASNLRLALAKEPRNADAQLLFAVSLAAGGETAEAQQALAAAEGVDRGARERLSRFLAAHPQLRAPVQAAFAPPAAAAPGAPGARPGPAVPAPATPGAAARAFRVGERVEVEYRNGFWVPGVVTSVDAGACPAYRVRHDPYGDGVQRELVYYCRTTRAVTGVAQPRAECGGSNGNCPPTSPPPLGRYVCDQSSNGTTRPIYHGYFELLPGGRYRWLDNGGTGTYRYDPATHGVRFLTGPMRGRGQPRYGLDGSTPEITITMATPYTRRTGNAPPVWQCGLRRR